MIDEPDRDFGFLLSDAARLLRRDFDRRARTLELNRAQWSVLARLSRNEGVTQNALAEILEVQPITLARQVDRLEAGGWVQRCADPEDRRVRRLRLTREARPILEELRALGRETRAEALAGFTEAERRQLTNMLARVRRNLGNKENDSDEAGHEAQG